VFRQRADTATSAKTGSTDAAAGDGSTRSPLPRREPRWQALSAAEVALAVVAVLADWLIPSLVLVALAGISLAARRAGPSSLGLRRPVSWRRLIVQMLGFALAWTLVDVGVLIPLTNHLSGRRQDVSQFADLQGNLGLLCLYLAASWVVAAFCEETAFRGYLLTRLTEVVGNGRLGTIVAALVSSLLFGMLHTEQGVVGVVVAAFAGLVFTFLRYRLRTLWAPVFAHGFDDTIGFVWFFFFGPFYGLW
jgi:membrane protease YdiL (CAAX protease family)